MTKKITLTKELIRAAKRSAIVAPANGAGDRAELGIVFLEEDGLVLEPWPGAVVEAELEIGSNDLQTRVYVPATDRMADVLEKTAARIREFRALAAPKPKAKPAKGKRPAKAAKNTRKRKAA